MSPIVGRSCRPVQHQVEPGCTRFGEHQRRATLTPQTDSAAGTTFLRNNNWDSDLSDVVCVWVYKCIWSRDEAWGNRLRDAEASASGFRSGEIICFPPSSCLI